MMGSDGSHPSELALRAPDWLRDLTLGMVFGVALLWAFFNATFDWENFNRHLLSEAVSVSIPFALALLSPRKLLVIFLGLCIILCRLVFLIFILQGAWSMLAAVLWLVLLVLLWYIVNRRYEDLHLPDGFTAFEFLLFVIGAGGGLYLLYLLRHLLGLN